MTVEAAPVKKKKNPALPKPERYALVGSEDAHQISLFMWAATPDIQAKYPQLKRMFAIPNGGFRYKSEGGRLKAMGVKRGVSDIFLPVPKGSWHGLFIELKRPKQASGKRAGRTEPEQSDWIEYFKSVGYGACICTGWEQARDMIIGYLEWKEK